MESAVQCVASRQLYFVPNITEEFVKDRAEDWATLTVMGATGLRWGHATKHY